MSVIDDLRPTVHSLLGIRDQLGAALATVKIVTRTWSGTEAGEGTAAETSVTLSPSPKVVNYSHSIRLQQGGAVKQGDLVLKQISKTQFASQAQVDGSSAARNVEKFFEVGGQLYQAISVTEDHFWWNVQVRRLSSQTRYP